ncbi:MAG: winged helix-turn-helix domain-containing protein [Terracidiphilus sp.]|jgi:DNA-binding winged helix-turn-helix (wHTH) protein/tetratricopeptide (TPR) repeat protein
MLKGSERARFSSYEFVPRTGELSRSGIRLRLESQPARVLEMLIEAEGDLVTREDLIAALWPGEVEGHFDRRLDKAVAKLRASLNDDAVKPRHIETLKGRGYSFLGKVTIESSGISEGTAILPPEDELPSLASDLVTAIPSVEQGPHSAPVSKNARFRRRFAVGEIAVAAGLIVAASVFAGWLIGKPGAAARSRPVVLILGIRDIAATTEDAWISHSVAEWLSNDLGAGGELEIVQGGESPTLQERAAGNGCGDLPPHVLETARRAFHANMVVYGDFSALKDGDSGDRWRLDVCLKNARDQMSADSLTVIGPKGDLTQLVVNAGDSLRAKLGLKQLSSQSMGYLRATLPVSLTAARLYTEGTSALQHFEPQEASVLLTEAAQIEPMHAATHAALSDAWAELGYEKRSQDEALLARNLAKDLSPVQQIEYEGLAASARNDWTAAVNAYARLFQLDPENVDYGLKLANAQIHASNGQLALATLHTLRDRNKSAQTSPQVDLAEASADSAISDFRGELAAGIRAQGRAAAQGSDLMVADALMGQANADDKLDNWDEALRLWRLAGEKYESIGDRRGMADALNHQALLAFNKDDAPTATQLLQQAMSLSKSIGDQAGIAYSLTLLGNVHLYVDPANGGDLTAALKLFNQAQTIYQETQNVAEEGNILSLFGDAAMGRMHFEEAKAYYLKAIAMSESANDKSRIANRWQDIGIVAEFEGKNQEAERNFTQSIQDYEALGQQDRVAIVRERLAVTLVREGKLNQAALILNQSLASMNAIGRRMQVYEARCDMIRLEMVRNPARAEDLARQNIDLSRTVARVGTTGDPTAFADLAEAEARQGKLKEAKQAIQQAFARGEGSLAKGFLQEMILQRGYVHLFSHEYSGANADFQRSLKMSVEHEQGFAEMESRLALAELHVCEHGKSAMPELDRVKHDAEQFGYGIVPLAITAFLHSESDSQPGEMADARH